MDFHFLDGYLLEGSPPKAEVVKELLARRSGGPAAAPFYQGLEMLGARAPDLSLIALRLVLAGKKADDSSVVRLREIVERARSKGPGSQDAAAAYREAVGE